MKQKTIFLVILLLTSMFLSATNVSSLGLGVAPDNITIESALRGMDYRNTVFVWNLDQGPRDMELVATGDIATWTKFYATNDTNYTTPITLLKDVAPQTSAKVISKIDVPIEVSNGIYNGSIQVNLLSNATLTDSGQTEVQLAMPIFVNLNVTGEQNLVLNVTNIRVDTTEINFPLNMILYSKNEGNVRVKPKIDVEITKDGRYIDSFTHEKEEIEPGDSSQIRASWDTVGMVAGDYVANITITASGETIHQEDIPFELLPPGSLSVEGELESIYLQTSTARVGIYNRVFAHFINTGEIETTAKFICEVYLDDELIEVLESKEQTIYRYYDDELSVYIKPNETGTYLLRGYVEYSGKISNTKELTFQVGVQSIEPAVLGLVLGTTGIVVIVALYLVLKKKRIIKKKSKKKNPKRAKKAKAKHQKTEEMKKPKKEKNFLGKFKNIKLTKEAKKPKTDNK